MQTLFNFRQPRVDDTRIVPRPSIGIARLSVALFISFAMIVFLFFFIDTNLFINGIQELIKRPFIIGTVGLIYLSAFILRTLAWQSLLSSTTKPKKIHLLAILHVALLANHALPIKAGEFIRPYLGHKAGITHGEALVSTLLARLLDTAALLAIAAMLLPLTLGIDLSTPIIFPAVLILITTGFLLWLRKTHFAPKQSQMINTIWISAQESLKTVSLNKIFIATCLTIPSWILEAAVVYGAAEALGFDLSIQGAITVTACTILFQIIHLTPGGIGIYEASMTLTLQLLGMPFSEAFTLAVLTHSLKFIYAFLIGLSPLGLLYITGFPSLGSLRGSKDDAKSASKFELIAARLWNVLNEGKPFTPVFALGILFLLSLSNFFDASYWTHLGISLILLLPLVTMFYRFDFPLNLRASLWLFLIPVFFITNSVDWVALTFVLSIYLFFTVIFWGSIYYHIRIGTKLTNFTRFWRLVIENPDPTSGNFLEQVPKLLILIFLARFLTTDLSLNSVLTVEIYTLIITVAAILTHQWWFTWKPLEPLTPTRLINNKNGRISNRIILIVIDGCRLDRFHEAKTPFFDKLIAEGTVCTDMRTVYPARTVTAFSSMLTGAVPHTHGMTSNFVPSLGVKCESIFDVLTKNNMENRLVGIAHLVDAFGEDTVETVTALTPNEEIDPALIAQACQTMEEQNPEFLVLQTLSVDQTGHSRGSYYPEYLEKIEITDQLLEEFFSWCTEKGYLENTTVFITSDHGQGKGIGGHGHLTEPEKRVPFIAWGEGIQAGDKITETRSLLDDAPTVAYYLGVNTPESSVGQVLFTPTGPNNESNGPLAIVIPAYNEAATLPILLTRIPKEIKEKSAIIVVDDGSNDNTAELAQKNGADYIVTHKTNQGLGAALRSGLAKAREINASAAIYIDADLEYDPQEIPLLLEPIQSGDAEYVLGSRFLGKRSGHPLWRSIGNRCFTVLLNIIAGRKISDGQTGFRAFSKNALEVAEIIHDYNYAQVLTLNLLGKGISMKEVPITYNHRTQGQSFINTNYLWRVPLGMAREVLSK